MWLDADRRGQHGVVLTAFALTAIQCVKLRKYKFLMDSLLIFALVLTLLSEVNFFDFDIIAPRVTNLADLNTNIYGEIFPTADTIAFVMKTQLSEKQWNDVVAEVTRLAQDREDELTRREITTEVLKELNLPTDLTEEALQQVQYREALAKQRRQRIWMFAVSGILAALLVIGLVTWRSTHNAALQKIQAQSAYVTREIDNGANTQTITRDGKDVFYRVTLSDVPPGENLQMSCNWIDPTGKIFSQNRWETRNTNKEIWATHCRCDLGSTAPTGNWKVEMKIGDRVVSTGDFKVE